MRRFLVIVVITVMPDGNLGRGAIERHMDPERLRVMRLAEEQERDVLRSVWGGET